VFLSFSFFLFFLSFFVLPFFLFVFLPFFFFLFSFFLSFLSLFLSFRSFSSFHFFNFFLLGDCGSDYVAAGYNHPPSSSVGLHALLSGNLSVRSSTKIISKTIVHHKCSLYYFTKLFQFADLVCVDASLRNPCTVSLSNLNMTYHFLVIRQTAAKVTNQTHSSNPPPFILTVPNWLTIKSVTPLQHTQQLNLNTIILLAIIMSHNLGDITGILLMSTVFSLFHSFCTCIKFSHDLYCANCYTYQYTHLSNPNTQ
jgi:hypothetical protein